MSSNQPSRLPQRGIPKPTSRLPGATRGSATTTKIAGTTGVRATSTTNAPVTTSASQASAPSKPVAPKQLDQTSKLKQQEQPPQPKHQEQPTPQPALQAQPPAPESEPKHVEELPTIPTTSVPALDPAPMKTVKQLPSPPPQEIVPLVKPIPDVDTKGDGPPPNWAELEAKYKRDIEALVESAEMATIDKEIAEEKLENADRELQALRDKLAEAGLQIDMLNRDNQRDQPIGVGSSESTVTVLQLQKVEEQNELLKQAIVKLRDISTKDKQALEELQIEHEECQEKLIDYEEKEQKYLEQIKVFQEQIDVSHSAQEMVERLTQQKTALEDHLKELEEELDTMVQLRDLNDQIIENAKINEIELTGHLDLKRSQFSELMIKQRDMEDYLSDQERTLAKLKDENRALSEQVIRLKDQFKEGESIEQQKHQIENVAFKLNFSETKMAEKEAEIARYKRNLSEIEEQMNNLSMITKEQAAKIDELKIRDDANTSEISQLQRVLKKKMEEVSELEIRRDMAEKKLQSLQKDSETKITNLTRIIDTMKGVEVQHEEDMKRLMEDNEIIERERRELRDQLNKSNRSLLERSMQAGNLSTSMVTAQDTSLASLGISFQTTPSHQASPVHHHHQQQQQQQLLQQHQPFIAADPNQSLNLQSSSRSTSITSTPGPIKQMSLGPEIDDSYLIEKLKDLSIAFDLVNKKNYDLEMELAYRELNSRAPPYDGASLVSQYYDVDRAKVLESEMKKLKREIRQAMIKQTIPTNTRQINSFLRAERFDNSKLVARYQMLENEANALMSSSTLARLTPKVPLLLQSTPIK